MIRNVLASLDAGSPVRATSQARVRAIFLASFASLAVAGSVGAATIPVTTTADENDGAVVAGGCSLREAVDSANLDTNRGGCSATGTYGSDTITVPAGTYSLQTVGTQIAINDSTPTGGRDLTIDGAGADTTIIQAHASPATATWRLFIVNAGSAAFEDLTLQNGVESNGGAAIRFVSNNSTTLSITRCTLDHNRVTGSSSGGAVFLGTGGGPQMTITGSTFHDNFAGSNAGAIHDNSTGAGPTSLLTITNSTFFANTANKHGGAIESAGAAGSVIALNNVTITGNTADGNNAGGGDGGGIRQTSGTFRIANSILSGNTDATTIQKHPDCSASAGANVVTKGYNFVGIGDLGGCTDFSDGADGDDVGSNATPNNANLQGSLSDNGGTTLTLRPNVGSPVLEAGNPATPLDGDMSGTHGRCTAVDQRGQSRPVDDDCDMGAVEGSSSSICGDGLLEGTEDCEAPFGDCCDEVTCEFVIGDTVCRAGSGDICDPDEECTGSDDECPADVVSADTTLCNSGSGDVCDPDEYCTGNAGEACPADVVEPNTTVCNTGSGDVCDPDELCTGVAEAACPADVVDAGTTVCNAGSGDLCDPHEICTGAADTPCPADNVAAGGTVCNPGSGDICDPDEVCCGVANQACPADSVAPDTTVCNAGSGDLCDPDEFCSGVADQDCPSDDVEPLGTVCRTGSGDDCDPDELCTGVADATCPSDVVEPGTTVCNTGSGDLCDPDELCTGVAGQTCPADVVEPDTTVCNAGSGDVCDSDEFCSGVANTACPSDDVEPAGTVCRTGSGDLCDPAELCSGVADDACPADVVEPITTVCETGSGDLCDPDELCTGVAGQTCPADVVEPNSTLCNAGSGDMCDPDEFCTGVADDACPTDVIEPDSTVCNSGSGDTCDPDEFCTGVADDTCPSDVVEPATTICNAGSGDICDPDELCTGVAGQACPADVVEPDTTLCNVGSGDMCDPDELCTGMAGDTCPTDVVLPNTTECRASNGSSCDPAESCTGAANAACPANAFEPNGTACVFDGNVCTTDTCDGAGACGATNNTAPCDDGDACTAGDTCAAGSCTSGVPEDCDDGSLCTTDSCDSQDGCIHDAEPLLGACYAAGKANFQMKNSADDSKDKLKWGWLKGAAVMSADLGTPATTTTYALCIYDGQSGTPTFVRSLVVPPNAIWTEKTGQVGYKDKPGTSDGVTSIKAKAVAEAGKSSAKLKAGGFELELPPDIGGGLFLHADPLIVELMNSEGACWTTSFSGDGIKKNETDQFKATGN